MATINSASANTSPVVTEIEALVSKLAVLEVPSVAATVAAFVVTELPGVNISAPAIAGVLIGVGTVASLLKVLWTRKTVQKAIAAT